MSNASAHLEDAALRALARRFAGRSTARGALDRWLREADGEPRVIWCSGPPGIGKSALAQVFAIRAREAGHRVRALDARESAAPDEALGRGARVDVVVLEGDVESADVVGDRLARVLSGAGAALLVLATCRGPAPERLRAQPHLDVITRELRLRPLDDAEAADLLVRRGVSPAEAPTLVPLAAGSPRALVELADRARADRLTPLAQRAPTELADAVVGAVLRSATSPAHRAAIDALSVAGTLDVAGLARMLEIPLAPAGAARSDEADAAALLAWLGGQSFVVRTAASVVCQPQIRQALLRSLESRDPSRLATLRALAERDAPLPASSPHDASPAAQRAPWSGHGRASAAPAPGDDELALLVREALAVRHRPHALRESALVGLACVQALGGAPEDALGKVLDEACRGLAAAPGYAASARLLEITYLDPSTTKQEAAAAELGLPYGTYRYQLRRALELVTREIASREARARESR